MYKIICTFLALRMPVLIMTSALIISCMSMSAHGMDNPFETPSTGALLSSATSMLSGNLPSGQAYDMASSVLGNDPSYYTSLSSPLYTTTFALIGTLIVAISITAYMVCCRSFKSDEETAPPHKKTRKETQKNPAHSPFAALPATSFSKSMLKKLATFPDAHDHDIEMGEIARPASSPLTAPLPVVNALPPLKIKKPLPEIPSQKKSVAPLPDVAPNLGQAPDAVHIQPAVASAKNAKDRSKKTENVQPGKEKAEKQEPLKQDVSFKISNSAAKVRKLDFTWIFVKRRKSLNICIGNFTSKKRLQSGYGTRADNQSVIIQISRPGLGKPRMFQSSFC